MTSRKRSAPENNNVRRRRSNLNEVIVISDDETDNGVVADSSEPMPITPGRRTSRSTSSPSRTSGLCGCWPFQQRNRVMMQGESSRSNQTAVMSDMFGRCSPMFFDHYPYPPPPPPQEPVQLSQYRLENPYRRSALTELNQCWFCLQPIIEGHPNYIPFIPTQPVQPQSVDSYEEAVKSYEIDPQEWKEWVDSFNTPPHYK